MEIESKHTGSALTATEFNQIPDELENLITKSGITPSSLDLTQITKAVAQMVGDSDFYSTSGTANAIILSAVSPRLAPSSLTNGLRVRFKASLDNTGEVTVNVNNLGAKYITIDGTNIVAGKLQANKFYDLTYSTSTDTFELSDLNGANADLSNLSATGEAHFAKIFIATVHTTTFNEVLNAYNAGKTVVAKSDSSLYTNYYFLYQKSSTTFYFSSAGATSYSPDIYTYSLNKNSGWDSGPIYSLVRNTDSSIASSRFDGQWVAKYSDVASNTAINSYTHSLSDYLPNDSRAYEIFVRVTCYTVSSSSGGSGDFTVGTVVSPGTNNNSGYSLSLRVTTNSTQARGVVILPIGSSTRNFYSQIQEHKMNGTSIVLCGYRRIGTNS